VQVVIRQIEGHVETGSDVDYDRYTLSADRTVLIRLPRSTKSINIARPDKDQVPSFEMAVRAGVLEIAHPSGVIATQIFP